jgi:hypothetical protein
MVEYMRAMLTELMKPFQVDSKSFKDPDVRQWHAIHTHVGMQALFGRLLSQRPVLQYKGGSGDMSQRARHGTAYHLPRIV